MKHHIEIDFHKQYSSVAVRDDKGNITDERTLYYMELKDLTNYFSSYTEGTPVALEATCD